MNTHLESPPVVSGTQPLLWSVRRELWEYRSLYVAPLAVAVLFLAGFLISLVRLPSKLRATVDPMEQHRLMVQPYNFAALLIMGAALIVAVFYCLDALHGERRDRSILFWKSLPVSDLTTVLSKASIPLLVIPLISFVVTLATQWIMLLLNSAVFLANGLGLAMLWRQLPWFPMAVMLLFHLVAIHGFYFAPIYGWMLLVSAWARRAAFLWAFLPLLVIGVIEKVVFDTSYFASMLGGRLQGGAVGDTFIPDSMSMDPLMHFAPGHFLLSPGLWMGLAVCAAFLAVAVRLRRNQGPI